jgi:hypothetical protein
MSADILIFVSVTSPPLERIPSAKQKACDTITGACLTFVMVIWRLQQAAAADQAAAAAEGRGREREGESLRRERERERGREGESWGLRRTLFVVAHSATA